MMNLEIGILCALGSLAFAGVNDFIFKQYIHKDAQPLGCFIAGIGVVWACVFGAAMTAAGDSLTMTAWPLSLAIGVVSLIANLLFVSSFRIFPAGTGATVYRLNLVLVAIMGFVILHESVTAWKLAGILLGAVSILLLRSGNANGNAVRATALGALALTVACVLRAVLGILYKMASNYSIPKFEVMAICGVCWMVGGLIFAISRREPAMPTARTFRFSLVSGLLVCGIGYFLLQATSFGDASVVVPVAQLSFVVTTFLGVFFHREKFGWKKAMAMAGAAGCVVVISRG